MNDTLLTWLVYVIVAAVAVWALTIVTLLGRAIAVRLCARRRKATPR